MGGRRIRELSRGCVWRCGRVSPRNVRRPGGTVIRVVWDNSASIAKFSRDGGPLVLSEDLLTPVIYSLFVDAPRGSPVSPGQIRGGFWGDALGDDPSDVWGSRIWQRLKMDNVTRQELEKDVKDALSWMIRQGMVSSVGVIVEAYSQNIFAFQTDIVKRDGIGWSEQWEARFGAS